MELTAVIERKLPPEPWEEGEKIPWNEPGFSARMLQEHLSQDHDAASRRSQVIERHVAWIHDRLLNGEPARILDLGCGPGLYTSRLARLGHTCTGIDFSPASIDYARKTARQANLDCTYHQEDIRQADYGTRNDLVMLLYGEVNVFKPADARAILWKASRSLVPGGWLLLEPHTYEAVRQAGSQPGSWFSSPGGLFSAGPHLVLQESFWHDAQKATTNRHYVIEADGAVTQYTETVQAYRDEAYRLLLAQSGFGEIHFYPALGEATEEQPSDFFALAAKKTL